MSGLQGGRCDFDNEMILLINFERPTTCRYDMPHVVVYVVADVEVARNLGDGETPRLRVCDQTV